MKLMDTSHNGIIEGVIWKQLLSFFLPVMLGTLFQQLYNTVDAVIVGRFVGKQALAAVGGSSSQILNLLIGFFTGVSSGAAVIVSQYYGAGDSEDSSRAVHTAVILALLSGTIMTVLGLISAPWLLRIMNTPADTMADSLIYIRIIYLGMIPSMLYNMGSAILRAVGDSRHPLFFLIASCLINVLLDLLFVLAFKMGAAGVAIATGISQLLSAVMVCLFLTRAEDSVRLCLKLLRLDLRLLLRTVRIGLPTGLQAVMYSVSNMIIISAINGFGTDSAAAWVALGKVDSITWLILNAFGISIMTFVGQNYGAGKNDRVRQSVWDCLLISSGAMIFIGGLLLLAGRYIVVIFSTDAEVISIAVKLLALFAPFYVLYVPIEILGGALRGIGDTFIPFIITALSVCGGRIIWIYSILPLFPSMETVALCYPVTWFISSVVFFIYYSNVKKKRIQIA